VGRSLDEVGMCMGADAVACSNVSLHFGYWLAPLGVRLVRQRVGLDANAQLLSNIATLK
jgi:hypothetical protein